MCPKVIIDTSDGVMPHKTQHSTQKKHCSSRNAQSLTLDESLFSEGGSNAFKLVNPMGDDDEVCQQCTMYKGEKEEQEKVATWRNHQKVSKSIVSNKVQVERRQQKRSSSTKVG